MRIEPPPASDVPLPLVPAARHRRPLRFLVAGGLNTAFGLSVYPALLLCSETLHRRYMLGLLIAQATSLIFAFTTYKTIVFRTRSGTLGEFSRFLPFYLANYALSFAMLPLIVKGLGLDPIVGQFGFSMVVIATSYVWHSRITFRPARSTS